MNLESIIRSVTGLIRAKPFSTLSYLITSHLYLQVVMMSSGRLLIGPPPNIPSTQGAPAALAWLDEVLVLLPHSSQKSVLTEETFPSISLVLVAGRVRGWRPRDVCVFMGRGNQKVWVPAGLDLHMSTTEVNPCFLNFCFFLVLIKYFLLNNQFQV